MTYLCGSVKEKYNKYTLNKGFYFTEARKKPIIEATVTCA